MFNKYLMCFYEGENTWFDGAPTLWYRKFLFRSFGRMVDRTRKHAESIYSLISFCVPSIHRLNVRFLRPRSYKSKSNESNARKKNRNNENEEKKYSLLNNKYG